MDLCDYKFDFNAARRRDRDLVTDAGVPEREEHSLAGVRVDVAVPEGPGDRRARKVEGEVLRGLLDHDIALDVSLRDRQVDPKTRHLDPIPLGDRLRRWGPAPRGGGGRRRGGGAWGPAPHRGGGAGARPRGGR